jgi:glyoxylate/hydroxypyruvate reductase A
MGLATARALQGLGYKVSGWTRGSSAPSDQQARAGIMCYAGQHQLQEFVAAQDVLVCLLPLTAETTGERLGKARCQGIAVSR